MACLQTAGKEQICAEALGGINEILLVAFADLDGTLTITSNEVADSSATFTAYRYKVRNTSGEKQGVTETAEIGGSGNFFKQAIEVVIPAQTTADMLNFDALVKGRVMAFVYANDGSVRCYGRTRGMEAESGEISTGKEMGDFNGYKLTLAGEEALPAYECTDFTTVPLDNLSTATITYNPIY
tara:strand:- start:650 stop:1198 length:549 start_codon:yes stop_codon:yes gene_type:complete